MFLLNSLYKLHAFVNKLNIIAKLMFYSLIVLHTFQKEVENEQ